MAQGLGHRVHPPALPIFSLFKRPVTIRLPILGGFGWLEARAPLAGLACGFPGLPRWSLGDALLVLIPIHREPGGDAAKSHLHRVYTQLSCRIGTCISIASGMKVMLNALIFEETCLRECSVRHYNV